MLAKHRSFVLSVFIIASFLFADTLLHKAHSSNTSLPYGWWVKSIDFPLFSGAHNGYLAANNQNYFEPNLSFEVLIDKFQERTGTKDIIVITTSIPYGIHHSYIVNQTNYSTFPVDFRSMNKYNLGEVFVVSVSNKNKRSVLGSFELSKFRERYRYYHYVPPE